MLELVAGIPVLFSKKASRVVVILSAVRHFRPQDMIKPLIWSPELIHYRAYNVNTDTSNLRPTHPPSRRRQHLDHSEKNRLRNVRRQLGRNRPLIPGCAHLAQDCFRSYSNQAG